MLLWRHATVPLSAATSVEHEHHKTVFARCLFYLSHVQHIVFSHNCSSSVTMTSNLLFPPVKYIKDVTWTDQLPNEATFNQCFRL